MACCNYEFYMKRLKAVQSLIVDGWCTRSAPRCHLEPLGELDVDLRSSLDLGLPDADFRRWLGELERSLRLLGEFPAFGLGYLQFVIKIIITKWKHWRAWWIWCASQMNFRRKIVVWFQKIPNVRVCWCQPHRKLCSKTEMTGKCSKTLEYSQRTDSTTQG